MALSRQIGQSAEANLLWQVTKQLDYLTKVVSNSSVTTDGLTDAQLRAEPLSVIGTFYQAIQPISATSLPLPLLAATSTLQTSGNTSLASIDTKTPALGQALAASSIPVVLPATQITALTPPSNTGYSTSALQTTGNSFLSSIDTKLSSQATATLQGTGNTSLSSINTLTKPFQGAVAMTVGTTYTAQRSISISCTVAGNVNLELTDASTIILPVAVGLNVFPFAVTRVLSASTTATATYYNLI